MSTLENKLLDYATHSLNVLLVGAHGIGKTALVKETSKKLGLKLQYYSASTLDPWADLVGIPVPDKDRKVVDFYRPVAIQDAEFIFFDELNRAHPKVLQTLLEIIQFKSINGVKLDKLKMVWGAINPPGGEYQVEDLDPALVDRFHVYIKMNAELNKKYLKTVMSESTFLSLREWWSNDCSAEQRQVISPRRVEYLGLLIEKGLPWKDCLPQGHRFPVEELARRLSPNKDEADSSFSFTKESILENKELVLEKIKNEPKYAIKVSQLLIRFSPNQLFECRELIEEIPKELFLNALKGKYKDARRAVRDLFQKNNVNVESFPKMKEFIKEVMDEKETF